MTQEKKTGTENKSFRKEVLKEYCACRVQYRWILTFLSQIPIDVSSKTKVRYLLSQSLLAFLSALTVHRKGKFTSTLSARTSNFFLNNTFNVGESDIAHFANRKSYIAHRTLQIANCKLQIDSFHIDAADKLSRAFVFLPLSIQHTSSPELLRCFSI